MSEAKDNFDMVWGIGLGITIGIVISFATLRIICGC
jgi:hypothetical protein